MDDLQKHLRRAWKADQLITVGALVQLFVATVGWVGAGMEVVVGKQVGQCQMGWSHVGRCRSTF